MGLVALLGVLFVMIYQITQMSPRLVNPLPATPVVTTPMITPSPVPTPSHATTSVVALASTTSKIAILPPPSVPRSTQLPSPTKPLPVLSATTTNPIASTTTRPTKLNWGVFTGSNPTSIGDFETRVPTNPDYLAYFVHWGNDAGRLPSYLKKLAADKDRTLVLFWEASDYIVGGTNQPTYSYKAILNGDWDSYFTSFAKQLKSYGGPIILVPFSELNGNWTPWSGTKNGNTPAQAVLAYRYVHTFFTAVNNVSFGWTVNAASVPDIPSNQIEHYYPGDEYVDYVGVDGFNMDNPWLSFETIFKPALQKLSLYNKPTLLFSFASADGPQKADWLHDALYVQLPKYPQVTGWVYFNQNKERNWLLWSDPGTYSVFTTYITE
jgi:beta-mannanase